jgi:signal peptidase II
MPRVPFSRYMLFVGLATLGCAADLWTKAWAFSMPALRAGGIHWLWEGHVGFQLNRNWGALFGMGQGMYWIFAGLAIVASIAIPVWLFYYRAAADLSLTVILGLITGGIWGNLYDRLGLSRDTWGPPLDPRDPTHAVRDWVLWQVNDEWRWPNFNVADALLVVGAILVFVKLMREPKADAVQNHGSTAETEFPR